MTPTEVLDALREYRDGCHGESELRAVATFLLDSVDENDPDFTDSPEEFVQVLCDFLAEACRTVRDGLTQFHRRK